MRADPCYHVGQFAAFVFQLLEKPVERQRVQPGGVHHAHGFGVGGGFLLPTIAVDRGRLKQFGPDRDQTLCVAQQQ